MEDRIPADIRLGIVRGISYGLFGQPDEFMPQLRSLGASLVRVYVYWSQVEPEPGHYTFDAVDAFLNQLDGSEEVWVTICSSSPWATRQPSTFLPPSPAKDPETYYRFVRRLAEHCAGRVRYWQCDNEPCNIGLLWSGTADEYAAQLATMHRAVRDADPGAAVVLGGAPYALPSSPPESPERQFFDLLLRDGRDHFDIFDLHLYGDARLILSDIATVREWMRAHGYEKPVVVGEYNAPWPASFPAATDAMQRVMAAAFAAPAPSGDTQTPEQRAMADLYAQMPSLPPQLQMFMQGCPPELAAQRHRMNCREIAMRNLLALSAGIRRTICWNLAPEIPNYQAPLSIMDLMFGKFALLDYEGNELRHRYPSADAFALVAGQLAGVERVAHIAVPERPGLCLFEVQRGARGPLLVVWAARDPFTGEDEPPVPFEWPWRAPQARAIDALGQRQPVEVRNGRVALPVGITPIFIGAA
jgi:hypothetical protein